jgi:hypothetical protein
MAAKEISVKKYVVKLSEAERLVERFEWHYTPKHGSWLDLAESELGVLSCQCLDRRIPDKQTLIDEIEAWENERNANHAKANWHFTTPDVIAHPPVFRAGRWLARRAILTSDGGADSSSG